MSAVTRLCYAAHLRDNKPPVAVGLPRKHAAAILRKRDALPDHARATKTHWRLGKRATVSLPAAATEAAEAPPDEATELLTSDESDTLLRIRHSSAHLMAMAVQRLYPGAKCTIGPWIDFGFYYDFDMRGHTLAESDLKAIQKEMERIIRQKLPFVREEVRKSFSGKPLLERGEAGKGGNT